MSLEITKKLMGELWELKLAGRLDAVEAPVLERELDHIPESCKTIELEFSAVDYIASAGLRSLVLARKKADKVGARLLIKDPRQSVKEVFDVTGFGNIMEIVYTGQDAEVQDTANGFYPLRPIQRWLVDTHFNKANSTMMNVGALGKLDDSVDMERLAEAVNEVLNAHDIFRCRLVFHPDTGEICQRFDGSVKKVVVETLSEEAFAQRKLELEKPFQLIDRPLYRIYLMLTPSGKFIYEDFYHAILDGIGVCVLFWREMDMRYQGRKIRRQASSYAEYVLEESRKLQQEDEEGHNYWRQQLAGFDTKKHLPPMDRQDDVKWHENQVVHDIQNIRHEFFRDSGANEHCFMLAGAMLAMAKVTGEKEVIMSWVHHARTSAKELRLMGLMLNQLPIRSAIDGTMTAAQFLQAVEEKVKQGEAYAHSLDEVYKNDWEGECASFILQKNTDIKAAFVLDGKPIAIQELPANKISAAENVLDIALTGLDDGSYILTLTYDGSRYSEVMMQRYAEAFDEVLLALQTENRCLAEILS